MNGNLYLINNDSMTVGSHPEYTSIADLMMKMLKIKPTSESISRKIPTGYKIIIVLCFEVLQG